MKIQSIILAGMLTLASSVTFMNTAFADTPTTTASVSATCKDGTAFTGANKKGACKGHKGVKAWADATGAATATAAVVDTKPAPANNATSDKTTKDTTKVKAASTATMAEAPGGGAGKVWVNSKSKTYHCQGTKYYGKTKAGAYMTEAEAKAQGNHADHGKACS
ncbi:MAG: hypothetical protein WBP13_12150 [Methylophilaceae bacterium]